MLNHSQPADQYPSAEVEPEIDGFATAQRPAVRLTMAVFSLQPIGA